MFTYLVAVIGTVVATIMIGLSSLFWPATWTMSSITHLTFLGKYALPMLNMIIFGILDASGFFIFDLNVDQFESVFGTDDKLLTLLIIGGISACIALINALNIESILERTFPLVYFAGRNVGMEVMGILIGTSLVIFSYLIYKKTSSKTHTTSLEAKAKTI
jgi:uncharacterized membrane protein